MAASNSDYFTHVSAPTATTLASPGHTIGGTTFNVGSTSNWSTDTGVFFSIDTVTVVNGVEIQNPGTYTVWEAVVSGPTTVSSAVLRFGTDQNYPAGSTTRVYISVTSSRENRLVDGLLNVLNQNATLKTNSVTTTAITDLSVTTAKIADANVTTTKILDANVTTAKIADDAVTDAKLINGKVLKRQGGSATSWGLSGGTNYDVSATDVKIQTGTTGTSAGGDVTITFGTAFTYPPTFVCSVSGGNAGDTAITANCFAEATQVTATGATLRTFNTSGGQSNQAVAWIAMGV